jgi:hypothetical protein
MHSYLVVRVEERYLPAETGRKKSNVAAVRVV